LTQLEIEGVGKRDKALLGALADDPEGEGAAVNGLGAKADALADAQAADIKGLAAGADDRNFQGMEECQAFGVFAGVRDAELARSANLFLKSGQERARVFWKRKKRA